MKVAAIDIGSNAIRLAIAKKQGPYQLEIIKKIRVPLRLGAEAFSPEGFFSKSTIDLAKEVFISFAQILKNEKVDSYKAFATSAFRDAENSKELAKAVKKSSGITIEKMSGDHEAKFILDSVLRKMELSKSQDYLLFDLGGGSLELSQIEEGVIAGSKSFDLGTVRLMNFMKSVNNDPQKIMNKLEECQDQIRSFLGEKILRSKDLHIIGTGGSFRRLLKIRRMQANLEDDFLSAAALPFIKKELESLSYLERIKKFELRPDRADIILPAITIIEAVVNILPVKKIYTPNVGLVNGILNEFLE